MKLRIRENILRFRLGKTEVERFYSDGLIVSEIKLGHKSSDSFSYELRQSDLERPELSFTEGKLICLLPKSEVVAWVQSEQVGIYHSIEIEDMYTLEFILEKDFKCLVERSNEDDDGFPHPNVETQNG